MAAYAMKRTSSLPKNVIGWSYSKCNQWSYSKSPST